MIFDQVREGFIIDDEDEEPDDRERARKKRERRRKRHREEEEAALDDEDLDLIGEANPEWERKAAAQVIYIWASRNGNVLLTFFSAEAQAS